MVQIFFGCPHRCSSPLELEDSIARLLLANKVVGPRGIVNSIKELAKSIIEINGAFLTLKIPLIANIMSIYSKEQEMSLRVSCSLESKGLLAKHYCTFNLIERIEQIFDEFTSTLDLPLETRVESWRPHMSLCKMALSDGIYECINRQIRKAASCRSSSLSRI